MTKLKIFKDDAGASPVIGVMLMIVVTVILAAAVSAFATSVDSGDKAPQLSLKTSASEASGLTIEHMGGDVLAAGDIKIQTYLPSGSFAGATYEINKSTIVNLRTKNTLDTSDEYIKSGDVLSISNINDAFGTGGWGTVYKPNIGEQFKVEIYHTRIDKPVAISLTLMNP